MPNLITRSDALYHHQKHSLMTFNDYTFLIFQYIARYRPSYMFAYIRAHRSGVVDSGTLLRIGTSQDSLGPQLGAHWRCGVCCELIDVEVGIVNYIFVDSGRRGSVDLQSLRIGSALSLPRIVEIIGIVDFLPLGFLVIVR